MKLITAFHIIEVYNNNNNTATTTTLLHFLQLTPHFRSMQQHLELFKKSFCV